MHRMLVQSLTSGFPRPSSLSLRHSLPPCPSFSMSYSIPFAIPLDFLSAILANSAFLVFVRFFNCIALHLSASVCLLLCRFVSVSVCLPLCHLATQGQRLMGCLRFSVECTESPQGFTHSPSILSPSPHRPPPTHPLPFCTCIQFPILVIVMFLSLPLSLLFV